MMIKKPADIQPSEITDENLYRHRRSFIKRAAALGLALPGVAIAEKTSSSFSFLELFGNKTHQPRGDSLTPYKDITTYNNFYEFGTGKSDPAQNAGSLRTRPWTLSVEGLVRHPKVYDIDVLLKSLPAQERIYRHRCVEGWSMVIPWMGFPLAALLKQAEPLGNARFVEFTTLYDPKQMPGQRIQVLKWPYVEGLRLDEALHPLTLLATGLYGKPMPNQNGAPLRLVVPWKYGFKSIKSIVRIHVTDKMPQTTWNLAAADEYGFYSNVNPSVDHPRWSQATERRIGELGRRSTLLFNGYAREVAHLYQGMDLKKNF